MKVIEAHNLIYSYQRGNGETPALKGVSFDIEEGEYVAILGQNGSGKSTLAKMLNGLIVPSSGTLSIYGMQVGDDNNTYDIRKTVGMVFQNPDNQTVAQVVEDDIAFGPENIGMAREDIERSIDWALEVVGMSGHRKSITSRLSGGQKQRIAIAGVLALHPRVLVLDESTAMLDPDGRAEIMALVKRLNKEEKITVIYVTHFMDEAHDADKVIVLDNGTIGAMGASSEIFSNRDLLKKYKLTLPPLLAMEDMLIERGLPIEMRYDIGYLADEIVSLLKGKTIPQAEKVREISGSSIIKAQNLSYTYMPNTPFSTVALDDVNLDIVDGEMLGIIGRTGSGKSTLIQHFNGLIRVQGGALTVCNEVMNQKRPDMKAVRRKVGMVFQYPEYQLFAETVAEDVAFGPRNLGVSSDMIERVVRDAITLVGLDYDSIKDRSPFELSGGQKRRVAIAGVIAMRPEVLILDEPTAGLDPEGKREILELVKTLHSTCSRTVIMISHNMDEIADMSDRIAVMKQGKIYAIDNPRAIFANKEIVEKCNLHLPLPSSLAIALKDRGLDIGYMPVRKSVLADTIARIYGGALC